MGRRKEERVGSCSGVIKIIWIIWLFLLLCVCIHIHLGRCWYSIGEYNEIWRRSPLIVKNTCGSYVCFVQFSQSIRIRVHGTRRFKEIAPSANHMCAEWQSHCTICTYCVKAIALGMHYWVHCFDMQLMDLLQVCIIICICRVCSSPELIKQKKKSMQQTNSTYKQKEESVLIIPGKLIFRNIINGI